MKHLRKIGCWIALSSVCCIVSLAPTSAFLIISNQGKPAFQGTTPIHYRFNTTPSGFFKNGVDSSGTPTDEFQPIRAAFSTWSNLPGVELSFVEDAATSANPVSGDGHNTIMWVPQGWGSLSFHPSQYALAVTLLSFNNTTGEIADADMYFNATDFKWAVVDSNTEGGYVDVQNIATHEIGHLLGLDHSSQDALEDNSVLADATMYYASSTGETSQRDPHPDDMNAITSLYGTLPRPAPSLQSANLSNSTDTTLTYTVQGANFDENTSFTLTKNQGSVPDAVSRYRNIESSTTARVTFEVPSEFVSGPATLVAYNSPSQITQLSLSVVTSNVASSGGGCSLQIEETHLHKNFLGIFCLLACFFSLGLGTLRYVWKISLAKRSRRKNTSA